MHALARAPEWQDRIVAEAGGEVADALEARLRSVFSLRIPVKGVAPGSLPVFEVKANRWKVER